MEDSSTEISQKYQNVQPNNERVLYDALHIIFNYLNIYDLNNSSKVCKSWYHTAKQEKIKRGPQVMILQALEDFVATKFSNIHSVNKHQTVDDFKLTLRIKPSIGLFFTDGKYPTSADCDNVTYEICKTHRWTRPDNCFYLSIQTLGINVNNNAVGGERNITAAVFFPILPSVNYAIAETSCHCIEQFFRESTSLLTDMSNKLFSMQTGHVCFLIFMYQWKDEPIYQNYHNNFLDIFLDALKLRYEHGSYSLWGGTIDDIFTIATDERLTYHSTSFCAMAISGSSIRSWSLILNIDLSDVEIAEKLENLKKHVHLQSSSLAFIILPARENTVLDRSKINIFKNIFPTVTLLSIFNNKNHSVLSADSMINAGKITELKYTNCYAYMLLTYKRSFKY